MPRRRRPFDSDSDSVDTASTVESDQDSDRQYAVEEVLAERRGLNGRREFLLKWQGYELGRATWEPYENIDADEVIEGWESKRAEIAAGLAEPFDVEEFTAACEELEAAKARRKSKRTRKRRARARREKAMAATPAKAPASAPVSERRKALPKKSVWKKGVARPVKKRSGKSIERWLDDDEDGDGDDGDRDARDSGIDVRMTASVDLDEAFVEQPVQPEPPDEPLFIPADSLEDEVPVCAPPSPENGAPTPLASEAPPSSAIDAGLSFAGEALLPSVDETSLSPVIEAKRTLTNRRTKAVTPSNDGQELTSTSHQTSPPELPRVSKSPAVTKSSAVFKSPALPKLPAVSKSPAVSRPPAVPSLPSAVKESGSSMPPPLAMNLPELSGLSESPGVSESPRVSESPGVSKSPAVSTLPSAVRQIRAPMPPSSAMKPSAYSTARGPSPSKPIFSVQRESASPLPAKSVPSKNQQVSTLTTAPGAVDLSTSSATAQHRLSEPSSSAVRSSVPTSPLKRVFPTREISNPLRRTSLATTKSVSPTVQQTALPEPPSTSKVFAGDWSQATNRKPRPPPSYQMSEDSSNPRFTSMGFQNNYNKSRQVEPSPDPSALKFIDPKIGRPLPSGSTGEPRSRPAHSSRGRKAAPSSARPEPPALPDQPTLDEPTNIPKANLRPSTGSQVLNKHTARQRSLTAWNNGAVSDSAQSKKKYSTSMHRYQEHNRPKTAEQCELAHQEPGSLYRPLPESFGNVVDHLQQPSFNRHFDITGLSHGADISITEGLAEKHSIDNHRMASDDDILTPEESSEADAAIAVEELPKFDWTAILGAGRAFDRHVENVFIHFPGYRKPELEALKQHLERLGRKVFTSHNREDWKFFSKSCGKSCLLVFHPDETFLSCMPGLQSMLRAEGPVECRVFTIGVQRSLCRRQGRRDAYEAQSAFPKGDVTFITDDVFIYYPKKAISIIRKFLDSNKTKPKAGPRSKIGARPGVKDWLRALARKDLQKHSTAADEAGGSAREWLDLYATICELCPPEDEQPDCDPGCSVPLPDSYLYSENPLRYPSFQGLWEKSEKEATELAVDIFGGYACKNILRFREFKLVYARPEYEAPMLGPNDTVVMKQFADPHSWMKKYNLLSVLSPEHALRGEVDRS